jgi:hypothetical protein
MKITNTLYSYPVLATYDIRQDYSESSRFSVEVSQIQTGNSEYVLDINFLLNENNLNNLIKIGDAAIYVHISSTLTSHRVIQKVDGFTFKHRIELDSSIMSGTLEITAVIVATKKIINFSSENFSVIFTGIYTMSPGDILAFAPSVIIKMDSEDLDTNSKNSIIKIRVNNDDINNMNVNFEDDHILISLPKKTFSAYNRLAKQNSIYFKLSLASVIMPSLMEAISSMKNEENEDYQELKWYRVIKSRLFSKYGNEWKDTDVIELAQFLLNNPFKDLFKSIENQDDNYEEL